MSQPATATTGFGARLADRTRPLRFYSITPPRASTPLQDLARVGRLTVERLAPLGLDALILYDIQDEGDRTQQTRPFPYLATVDAGQFREEHLVGWDRPVVVYRSVGKYEPAALRSWLARQDPHQVATVLVGASSRHTPVRTTLDQALSLWRDVGSAAPLGGVTIPERHAQRIDEHERMLRKQESGCSFFVTQVIYDLTAAKDLASDYAYACRERGIEPAPLVFTLSVCGSLKTLEFLQWLGVHVPRWLQNQLVHSQDPLTESYEQCTRMASELDAFCRHLGVPFGFNVESVSVRRVEIEESVRLAAYIEQLLAH